MPQLSEVVIGERVRKLWQEGDLRRCMEKQFGRGSLDSVQVFSINRNVNNYFALGLFIILCSSVTHVHWVFVLKK